MLVSSERLVMAIFTIAELAFNRVAVTAAEKYISFSKIVRRFALGLVAVQLFFVGLQIGLILLILPWVVPSETGEVQRGLSLFGGILSALSIGALIYIARENFWVHWMGIDSLVAELEKKEEKERKKIHA